MSWSPLPRRLTGSNIAYHIAGSGPPVVLLHGVGLEAGAWGKQIPSLAAAYTVYAPDIPGHGESPMLPVTTPAIQDFGDALARFIERDTDPPVVLAGHSMGALLALDIAARHPALVQGAAALNAIYRRSEEARAAVRERARALAAGETADPAREPVPRWFGPEPVGEIRTAAEACRRWLRGNPLSGYSAAYSAFAAGDAPADDALRALRVPVLFMSGTLDGNATPAMSRRTAALVPRGRACIVAGAGHMAPVTHAAEVNDELMALAGEAFPDRPGQS